jgi:hypothetical protein
VARSLRRQAVDPSSVLRRSLSDARHRSRIAYRRASQAARALPTFLIIGTQKGGTTSLHEYLDEHPQIGSATLKEVQYFSLNFHRPLDWYQAHFPRDGEYTHVVESSPYYLFHPSCPDRVRATLPDVKLIVLLRDPVARAHSHHNHEVALGFETLDFRAALDREPERLAGEADRLLADNRYRSFAHQHHSYVARGMYAAQLDRWLERFPREQMLILPSEDLFGDPAATVHRVQAWLGLPEHTPASLAAANARSYKPMESEMREELGRRFRADSARLPELTGVQFPWV